MMRRIPGFLAMICAVVMAAPPLVAEPLVPRDAGEISLSFAPVVRQAAPAVVNIYGTVVVQNRLSRFASDPFFDQFFGGLGQTEPKLENSLGSGVVVSDDGLSYIFRIDDLEWADGEVVTAAEPGQSLAGTGVTVFDLQMPFLYWTDFTYEGQARVRGRPTYSFVLRPPAGQPVPEPELTGVRVLIDTQFQAMVQAELLGAGGAVLKSISLLDLKKVGEQWLVKAIDVRDHRTRDKTRFTVRAAALDLAWPAAVFTPAGLASPAPAVPGDKVVRF